MAMASKQTVQNWKVYAFAFTKFLLTFKPPSMVVSRFIAKLTNGAMWVYKQIV